MYESHFGFSGSPFQLNPDPSFYFDSQGHRYALSYLKFGVSQGEGFIVVTGEIGAGKTTLVRTLLEGLSSDEVVAAQIVNTQLQSSELLQAILTAFGAPQQGRSKAELLASLQAFLTGVADEGRRALLIVDEAQNLDREAIEELRMLSNFQVGNHALLQSFLVGQPELRKQMESRAMEQLRQRIIASCHLGPLTRDETRAYIEHRLRHVGWDSNPAIDEQAFDVVFESTGGIPRAINLLCNRLLLAAFLGELTQISAQLARQTANDLVRETGDFRAFGADSGLLSMRGSTSAVVSTLHSADEGSTSPELHGVKAPAEEIKRLSRSQRQLSELSRPLLCIADAPVSYLAFATLARAMQGDQTMPPVVLVNPGSIGAVEANQMPSSLVEAIAMEFHLNVGQAPLASRISAATMRFDALLDEMAPCAVISSGNGDDVLSCVHLASKRGLPLVRLGAGQRRQMRSIAGDLNAMLLDRMSDVLYTPTLKMHYTLYREGISADRVVCVGTPLVDGLRMALTDVTPISDLLRSVGLPREQMRRAINGYVLFSVQADSSGLSGPELVRVAKVARDLGKETLTIWFASEATVKAMSEGSLDASLQRSGVALVPYTGYAAQLGLIRGATCVISGPGRELVEEANCLDVPTIAVYPGGEVPSSSTGGASAEIACDAVACARALHKILERGRAQDEALSESEDDAVVKILEHLRGWLPASNAKGASRTSSIGVATR